MTAARSATMNSEKEQLHHCMNRCVRRSFLCGDDPYSKQNYDHRKGWMHDRLKQLGAIFCIDICGYAIMSNHYHLVLRNRPDLVIAETDEEIIARWRRLSPHKPVRLKCPEARALREELLHLDDLEMVDEFRSRLSSISWFMSYLNAFIARRANMEDGCTGRFWEGRFKNTALLDQAAVLECSVYVDLNPIRAGLANTPETSDYTSVQERITDRQNQKQCMALERQESFAHAEASQREGRADWLCPLIDTAGRKGFLHIDLDQYLKIVDLTGRIAVEGKKGAIPRELELILKRLQIDELQWLNSTSAFEDMFYRVAGTAALMKNAAIAAGQKCFKRKVFKVEKPAVSNAI